MKQLLKSITPKPFLNKYRQIAAKQKTNKLNKIYAGNDVQCPICNSQYREFAPYGVVKRTNAQCLKCSSLERHRLLYLYLKRETEALNEKRENLLNILHFAPEKSFYDIFAKIQSAGSHSASKDVGYIPCDLFPEKYMHGKIPSIKVDITDIPFKDNTFDLILCNHVLEHIPDDHKAMTEISRVLKPGGEAILQVPIEESREKTYEDWSITDPGEREKHFGQDDHVRIYGIDYIDRLKNAGLKVKIDKFAYQLEPSQYKKYGLTEESIYIGLKA